MPDNHFLTVSGPFDGDDIRVQQMTGRESLGTVFQYDVTFLSKSPTLDLSSAIGDKMTVHVMEEGKEERNFNGFVTRVARLGSYGTFARYRATLHPWLHLLSARVNSRIFQHKSVPDIIKAIFSEHGFTDLKDSLIESYSAHEYVVQYRESDFNFVSRLMEHAGIYYYFKHDKRKHTLILCDGTSSHEDVPGYESVAFHPEGQSAPSSPEFVNKLELAHQWRSGAYASDEFDFTRPKAELLAKLKGQDLSKKGDYEVYDYPGGFLDGGAGQTYVRTRLEAIRHDISTAHGSGDVRGLGAGDPFKLTDMPGGGDQKYLIVSAFYDMTNNPVETGPAGQPPGYFHWEFMGIDSQVPYKPVLATRRPRVEGVQTAIVVGPGGEEILTDKYGRVKVQFHWDREGQNDQNSSCWVRVSQLWAGKNWGAMHIPRIGQEVLVDFLEGDPDRPVIVGRLYNAEQMPPYDLPANKTQSGIKSRSTLSGTPANFNELRFEDKKGSEEVYLQAEKDLNALVKHDEGRQVNHDRETTIGNDETVNVDHDREETVGHDETITIGNDRTETVTGNETVTIAKTRTLTVGIAEETTVGTNRAVTVGANESRTIGGNQGVTIAKNRTLDVAKDLKDTIGAKRTVNVAKEDILEVGTKLSINVKDEISITTGDATISMKKNGDITIKGKNITIDGSGKINVKASGDVIVKGSKVAKN